MRKFGNLNKKMKEVDKMSDNINQNAESGNIMQHIQDMIGDLLQNAVGKMHNADSESQLGGAPTDKANVDELSTEMGIEDIKNFVDVMQKFIDNVRVMVVGLETGGLEPGSTDDKFLEGYMATADNVLEIAAFTSKDPLTGLSNRYGFDNRLILEWNRAVRDKMALSLVIFSVDSIKTIEDTKTHDDLMKTISDTLVNSIKRTTDFIARWSDSEFAALLPITEDVGASIVAERIRIDIGGMDIPGIAKIEGKTPVSIGVCVHTPEPGEQPVDIINDAHRAYKEAKEVEGSSIVFA